MVLSVGNAFRHGMHELSHCAMPIPFPKTSLLRSVWHRRSVMRGRLQVEVLTSCAALMTWIDKLSRQWQLEVSH